MLVKWIVYLWTVGWSGCSYRIKIIGGLRVIGLSRFRAHGIIWNMGGLELESRWYVSSGPLSAFSSATRYSLLKYSLFSNQLNSSSSFSSSPWSSKLWQSARYSISSSRPNPQARPDHKLIPVALWSKLLAKMVSLWSVTRKCSRHSRYQLPACN